MSDTGVSLMLPRKAVVFLRSILNSVSSSVVLKAEDVAVVKELRDAIGAAAASDGVPIVLGGVEHVRCLNRVLEGFSTYCRREARIWGERSSSAEQIKASLFRHVFWRDDEDRRDQLLMPVEEFLNHWLRGDGKIARQRVILHSLQEHSITKVWQLLHMTEEELTKIVGTYYVPYLLDAVRLSGQTLGLKLRREEMVGLRFGVPGAKSVKTADVWIEKETDCDNRVE